MTDLPPAPAGAPVPAVPETPAEPAKQRNVLGLIALGVSAVGFIFACIPGALIVGWVLLPIGFILGLVGLFVKGKKWAPLTAIIVSVVGTIVAVVVFMSVVATAFDESFGGSESTVTQPDESTEPEPAASAAEEEPEAADSAYVVTIEGSALAEDYEGKDSLVVNFTFTNNSDEDANFMFATQAKAFQDGIELESAILLDNTANIDNALKDVKPGATIEVAGAYVLDGTSDVTVEVTELISFDDTLLASETFSVK